MITAVVVTYHPESPATLLAALADQCEKVLVVDNTPGGSDELVQACGQVGAELIELGQNVGIAAAQNIGIARALDGGATHVLLSDQDSLPPPGMVATLTSHLHGDVAAAGPVPREGDDVLVYTDHTWGPKRAEVGSAPLEVSFLLASGCLIRSDVLAEVGDMDASLFIDHVDLEWGMRARRAGYRLIADPSVTLVHKLGDKQVKVPGRHQPVHVHSATRNYYLIRNTIALMKRDILPLPWRIRYGYWITRFAAFNILVNPDRRQRIAAAAGGLRDGVVGRMGRRGSSQA